MTLKLGRVFFVIGVLLLPLGLGMTIAAVVDAGDGNADWRIFMTSAGVTIMLRGMLYGRLERFAVLVRFTRLFRSG